MGESLDDLVRVIPLMKKVLSCGSGVLDPEIKVLVKHEGLGAEGLSRKAKDGDGFHFVLGTY